MRCPTDSEQNRCKVRDNRREQAMTDVNCPQGKCGVRGSFA
jgi:hypothetical protein